MRGRFHIAVASATVMALIAAAAPVAVAVDARECVVGGAGVDALSPAGFAVKMSLLDFLVIQRALMTMQDERAASVLDRLRVQLSGQEPASHGPDR
jgi:hypothetical protein